MEKCIKTHGKSLQKRIDLNTEDADRWQQSLQQQFVMVVVAATKPDLSTQWKGFVKEMSF